MSADAENYDKTLFGFWVYLLTDFIMFACIFATYVVLQYGAQGAPWTAHLACALAQTLVLLFSSFTAGLAGIAVHRNNRKGTVLWWSVTALLGVAFMGMELTGLKQLVQAGQTWSTNALLSAFFTLLGTHGLHMFFALLWVLVLLPPVFTQGLTAVSMRRLTCLRMFWQFLNVVWIFIFTIVYLMGAL